jgi:Tfp pilus assembly protein PilF
MSGRAAPRTGGCALRLLLLAGLALAACAGPEWPAIRPAGGGAAASGAAAADAYAQGRSQLLAGRPGLAIAAFEQALAREGETVEALNGLAVAYAELGRDELAARYFQRALTRAPASVATLNNIGFAALRAGRLGLARQYLDRAFALAGDEERVRANRALLAVAEVGSTAPSPPPEPAVAIATAPPLGIHRPAPAVQAIRTPPPTAPERFFGLGEAEDEI